MNQNPAEPHGFHCEKGACMNSASLYRSKVVIGPSITMEIWLCEEHKTQNLIDYAKHVMRLYCAALGCIQ